jgi:hypothetical protein
MEPVQFSDALRLTGLSESQLREWCGKRGLFQPTVPARGPGRVALFAWQDLIALRILREIFSVFSGRASSWAPGVRDFRRRLEGQSFPGLWGKSAIFTDQHSATIDWPAAVPLNAAALLVPLNPHLSVLVGRAAPEELQGQLPLVTPVGAKR